MKQSPKFMALRQTAAILWPPVSFRSEQISKWTMALVVSTGPFITLFMVLLGAVNDRDNLTWSDFGKALAVGLGMSLLLTTVAYLVQVGSWIQVQFSPVHATLVPGLRKRLPWATAIPMLGGACSVVFLFYFLDKHSPLMTIWFVFILYASILVASLRARWLYFMLVGAVLLQYLPWKKIMGDAFWNVTVELVSTTWFVVPAGLAIAIWALRWTYRLRGDLHFDIRKKRTKVGAIRNTDSTASLYSQQMTAGIFDRYLMWRLTKAPGLTQAMQRLVTGPRMHWTGLLGVFFGAIAATAGLLWLENVPTQGGDLFLATAVGALGGLAIGSAAFLSTTPQVIWNTRYEQGLIGLTERAASLKNQVPLHLTYFVQQCLVRWVFSMGVALAFGFWTDIRFLQPLYIGAIGFCLLPGIAWVIRNYAEIQGTVHAKTLVGQFGLNLVLIGVAIKLLANYPETVSLAWCALMVAVAGTVALFRWRRVSGVAAMFPAGRAA